MKAPYETLFGTVIAGLALTTLLVLLVRLLIGSA